MQIHSKQGTFAAWPYASKYEERAGFIAKYRFRLSFRLPDHKKEKEKSLSGHLIDMTVHIYSKGGMALKKVIRYP